MNRIQMTASGIKLARAEPNEIYMTAAMRMLTTRPNGNGCAVTEAFIDRIVADDKYHCLPLVADTSKQKAGNAGALGHNYDPETGTFLTDQIGAFHRFEKVEDEYGVSLIGEARIAKRNRKVCAAIAELFERGALNVSFEILAERARRENGVTVIDAEDGNELIGMAVVSIPAYPEATALTLVAENQEKGADQEMDQEQTKRIAEQEARLKLAEEQAQDTKNENEDLKKKREEDERGLKDSEEKQAALETQLTEKGARIAELESQVAELTPFKAEAETLRTEKAETELKARQAELTQFAQLHGLDEKAEPVAKAIAEADYPALMAEAMRNAPATGKPALAPFAMASQGIKTASEYGGLLDPDEKN